ncbi:MAG: DUF4062 domain-containing protein [Ramlibacter sp.]
MKIFISSLIAGYLPLRQASRDAIESLGHTPVMAEDFRAQPNSPQVACLQGIRAAELVVLILVDRYGQEQPGSGVSPTHEEYLEARGEKPILLFVQEGVEHESRQAELLKEAQGWQGGLFREGFTTAEQLRTVVTRAIHTYELSHAIAPLDANQLTHDAASLLSDRSRDAGHQEPMLLRFALATGPKRQLLRPAELEAEDLADAIQQRAMFGSPRLFDTSSGAERKIAGDAVALEQESGARIALDEHGSITLSLPLERSVRQYRGFGGQIPSLIEETVVRELASAIAFSSWMLDHIDATQRTTHVAMAAKIQAPDFIAWRTQAEQDANPNSGPMRSTQTPDKPVTLDRPRAALKFDATRLAEDLMVPLRRKWKA